MARKNDIRYICYYTDGSAARQLEVKSPVRKKVQPPKARPLKKIVVRIDPVAVGGIVISAILLIAMLVGSFQLYALRQQAQQMRQYANYLSEQNASLSAAYESGYDLKAVEKSALALGMIPADQVKNITISVAEPVTPVQVQQESDMWERMSAFFVDLFA